MAARCLGATLLMLLFLFSSTVFAQTPAPSGLWVPSTSGTAISLSWTAPTDSGNNGDLYGHNVNRCEGTDCTPVYHAWVPSADGTSYTDMGVDTRLVVAGTTYRYSIVASWETGGLSTSSNWVYATAQATTGQPTGLRVTSTSETDISLSWTAPADDGNGALDGYNVYRCEGTGCTPSYHDWVPVAEGTSYTDTGGDTGPVNSGTTYRYAVAASRSSLVGFQSNWEYATAESPPPPALPVVVKVTGLKATAVSADSISLSWKPSVKDVMKAYSVYRCTVPQGETTCDPYDGLWLAALENTNTYTDTEVTPGETYRYAVAVEPFRREELSKAITVVAQMPQMLATPTGLMVTETDESSVRLRWTAPADDGRGPVQSIDIYRCNVDRSPDCSEFLYLTSRNPALTEYKDDNDVESETTYRYAVAAYRSDDEVSPWSNQVTATTERGRYASPTDLTVTATFVNAINLSWTAPADGILGYNVYRCSASGGGTNCEPMWHAWVANPGNAPPAPTSYTDTGGDTGSVVPGTTYRYQVAASFPPNYRNGDWSEAVIATAEGESLPEPIPTDLTVTAVEESGISLSWTAPEGVAVRGYDVWRCVEGNTPCTPTYLAWVTNGAGDPPPAPTEYIDTDVTAGTTYRYVVFASVGNDYTKTSWSNEVTAAAEGEPEPEPEPPATEAPAPTDLTVTAADESGISLSWTAPEGVDVRGYNVLRCEEGDAPCTPEWLAWVTAGDGDPPPAPTEYTDTAVTAGTTYRYTVEAKVGDDYDTSPWSNEVTATTEGEPEPEPEPPVAEAPAPTDLTVTAASGTSISLSWTAPEGVDVRGYNVLRCEEGETPCTPEWLAWVTAGDGDPPPAPTEYTDTAVTAGTTYRYTVEAKVGDDYDTSPWSNEVTATTEGEPEPEPEPPVAEAPAPTDLTVTAADETSISLSWTAPEGVDVRGYNVLRCEEGDVPCTPEWLAWVTAGDGDPPPAPTGYTDTAVTAGTTYRYTVEAKAGDDYDTSPWSNEVTATTEGEPEPEPEPPVAEAPAPTDLTVTAASGTSISLSWTAPEGVDVRGYNVLRCEEGETPCTPEWLAWVTAGDGDPPPAPTEYTDTAVTAGTTYRYTVEAKVGDDYDTSPWSNEVTATTEGEPEPEPEPPVAEAPAPTDLTVTAADESGISLSWTAPEGVDVRGYNVLRCEEGETPCTPEWLAWVTAGDGDPPPAPTEYTDTAVTAGTTYRYTVEAKTGDDYDTSPWSNQVTATTEGDPEPEPEPPATGAPTDLTVTAADETSISLSWTAPEGVSVRGYNVLRCEESDAPCTPEWLAWVTAGAGDPPPAPTGYTDTEVTADTTYRYTVEAQAGDDYDTSPWSNEVTATIEGEPAPEPEQPVVPAPTDLTVTAADESGISLSWTAPEGVDVRGYNVLRCEEGETPCTPEWLAWVTAGDGDPPPAPTEYTDTEVTAGTSYRYTVEAKTGDDYDTSPWSNQVTATTEGDPEPEPEPPATGAPTDLTVTATSETSISLSWTAPEGVSVRGYNVYSCEEGDAPCTLVWFDWVTAGDGDPPPAPTEYTDTEVTAGTTYRYTVEAKTGDDYDTSPWSNEVTAMAEGEPESEPEPEPEPPAGEAPTDLTVTAVDESGISLSWTAPEGVDVRGYNVLRCEESDAPCTPEWLAWVTAGDGDPPPAPTEYTDTDVAAGITYRYTVEAKTGDDYDTSPLSNQVTATVEGEPGPDTEPPMVMAPTDLTVTAADESGISLSWTAPGGVSVRGYNVLRCKERETPCTPEWLAWVTAGDGDPPPAPTEYTDTDVTPGTAYRYTVEAKFGDDYDTSPLSNQVTAQAGEADVGGPSPEERALTLESGMAALGRTMAGQAVDTFGGRFASLSTSAGTQAPASRRLGSFSGALKLAAEQMGIPMAVTDVDDVLHAGPEWGPWMSDADLLTEACSSTVSGCPEDTEGNLILGNLTLRQLLSQNSFQLALGESDDSGASAWTLWGRGNVSGFEGQSANELALDGEVVSGYLGLDYRWGTDTLLGVAVSHSTGDIDYEETETGAGELETTMRSVYPYAYWSPRPGLGLWGVLGYGSGETALTDTAVSNLETDVEMWMAALGGRSELFTLGQVDMAVKADAFSVRMESDTLEALESTRVDSGRLRLALEGRTSLALSEHSRLTPSLELGARWDSGDAETGLGAELGGALAYTNTRLGLSMEASGRYLLTHEEESFEEWGASVSACVSSGGDGTGLALTLTPVWGNAASGVDALWGADGRTRVEGMGLAAPRSASWQPDRLDLGLRYGSDTPHGLLSPFGEVGLQGSDTYSMRLGTQLDTATGWKLDFFGGHVSRLAETADNLVGLTASYGFGAAGMSQAFAGTMPATSNWSTCDKGPAQKMSSRTEPVTHGHEAAVMQPAAEIDNEHIPTAENNRTVTAVRREAGILSGEPSRTEQERRADEVIAAQQTEEAAKWFIPVANTSRTVMVVAQQTDEASETTPQAGAETHSDEAAAVSGENEKVTDKAVSGAMEEVTVKGIRRALKDALEVKRSSDHIVDTLSLKDIDAIPNVTIAEALVRLPGVNGTRDRGNQSQATIRGLGPRMVLGTVNGREVASSEPSRNIRWEQYPSELISQVKVYKTQSADLIAGGIAGTVNLDTVAPLDYDGPKYTFSGVGAYYEGGKDIPDYNQWGNKLSGSLVKAFNNKIGIALGVASQKQKNAFPSYQGWGFNTPASWQPSLPVGGGDLDGQGTTGYVPWGAQIEVGKIETDRIGLLGTLQFRPSDAIDIRYDVLYSEFDMDVEQDQTWYQGTGNLNNLQAGLYSDVVVVDDRALAATARSPVPGCIHRADGSIPQCFDIRHVLAMYDQENSVFTQGLNLKFSGDSVRVDADIAYSKAERKNYWHGLYFDDRNATFSYDFRSTPSVSVPEGSPSARPETAQLVVVDCTTGLCSGNDNEGSQLEDENWSYKLNINKSLDAGHLSSIDLGIRYSDRNKEVVWEQFKMPRGGDNPAQVLPDGFSSYTLSAFDTSPILTAPSFATAADPFGGLDFSLAYINEDRYWRVSEENLAGYIKANFKGSIGSSSYYTANVGVRVVDVGTESSDVSGAAIGNDYTEVLPSASINFFLDEENIIRLSVSRAISRPPLDELRVGKLINAPSGNIDGNTGNPLLTPLISKQLDLSYEWYFAPESLAAATAYYKKIDDYIGYTSFDLEFRDGRGFDIYGPKNEQEGYIRGVELTFQTPFTSLLPKALKGVSAGIYSNYAYAHSNIKELYPADNPYPLAGLAKHTAAVDLWFWRQPFDLRFGWKYHSAFTTGFGWDGSELNTLDAEMNVNASLAYLINDNLTLRVQGYNLMNERARITRNNNEHDLRRFDKYGRTYFFGVSWKMW